MKAFQFASLLVALSALSTNAIGSCYAYDYAQMQLKGEVILMAPADTATRVGVHRNPKEKHTFLKLNKPVCVAAGTNSYESAEENQTHVTLYTLKGDGLGSYAGKQVSVDGVLMHSFVSDAHTPLQFVVKEISEVKK